MSVDVACRRVDRRAVGEDAREPGGPGGYRLAHGGGVFGISSYRGPACVGAVKRPMNETSGADLQRARRGVRSARRFEEAHVRLEPP